MQSRGEQVGPLSLSNDAMFSFFIPIFWGGGPIDAVIKIRGPARWQLEPRVGRRSPTYPISHPPILPSLLGGVTAPLPLSDRAERKKPLAASELIGA